MPSFQTYFDSAKPEPFFDDAITKNLVKWVNEYIENNKKSLNKYQTEDTNLQVGTFMWNVDNLLDILKGKGK